MAVSVSTWFNNDNFLNLQNLENGIKNNRTFFSTINLEFCWKKDCAGLVNQCNVSCRSFGTLRLINVLQIMLQKMSPIIKRLLGNLFRQSVNINFFLIKTITSYLLHILIKQNKDIGVIFLGPPAFGKIKPRTVINYILKKKEKKKQKEIVNFRCRINVDAEYKYYITGFIRCLFIHQQKKYS